MRAHGRALGHGRNRSPVSFPRDGASPCGPAWPAEHQPALAERADTEVLLHLKDAEQAALNTLAATGGARLACQSPRRAETVDRSEVDAIVAQAEGSGASKPSRYPGSRR